MNYPGQSNTITFHCGHCGTKLEVPAQLAGVSGPCPSCRATITAPMPTPVEESPDLLRFFEDEPPSPPTPRQPAPQPYQLPQTSPKPITQEQPIAVPHQVSPVLERLETPAPPRQEPVSHRSPEEDGFQEEEPQSRHGRSSQKRSHPSPPPVYEDEEDDVEERRGGGFIKLAAALAALALVGAGAYAFSPQVRGMVARVLPKKAEKPPVQAQPAQPAPSKDPGKAGDPPKPKPKVDPEVAAETPPANDVNAAPSAPTEEPPSSNLLAGPRNFLETYLKAPTWQENVAKSIKSDELKERMAAYYKEHPYSPEKVVEIAFTHKQKLPNSNHQFYLFRVVTESNRESFPMVAEETDSGMKADWLSYVQFKDKLLGKFLAEPVFTELPQTFSAMLQRSHYFVNNVPDRDQKDAFALLEPDDRNEAVGWAFIPKYSNLAKKLEKDVEWSKSYFPIVDLKWVKEDAHPDQPYVRIMGVKQFNWRWYDPSFEDMTPGRPRPPAASLGMDDPPSKPDAGGGLSLEEKPKEAAQDVPSKLPATAGKVGGEAPKPSPSTPKPSPSTPKPTAKPAGKPASTTRAPSPAASKPAPRKSN